MPCRSDTSSRAPSILYSIQSESELKEPRLISASTHPVGFSIWLWGSPKLCGGTVSFDHFWLKVIGFIEHGGPLIFEHTHLCARRTCLSTIYICAKLRTPFSWWGQSKRPHSNLGRCRCVLFGTVSCIVILSARKIAPWSVEFVYQFGKWGWKSHVDTSWPTFKGTQIEYDWW